MSTENKSVSLDKVIVLIPSLDPDENLPRYFAGLQKAGFEKIVIVDDGSRTNTAIFDNLSQRGGIIVRHAVNQGKGRALKTGYNYVLNNFSSDEIIGVVTADADGQHSPIDTCRVAEKLIETGDVVLGCRDFDSDNVPFKSRFGNKTTTNVFKFLYGRRISDTQTGLRGIPYELLYDSMRCRGERFEYEIDFLIRIVEMHRNIIEVPIETIYYEGNRATHFSAVRDSIRIYRVILAQGIGYVFSSLSSFVVDIVMFAILTKLIFFRLPVEICTLFGTVIARLISATYNYNMNRSAVFKSDKSHRSTAPKYAILAILQLLLSWMLVVVVYNRIHFDTTIIKVIVDTCLFIVSFQVQKRLIFK